MNNNSHNGGALCAPQQPRRLNLTETDYAKFQHDFCSRQFVEWFGIYRVGSTEGAEIVGQLGKAGDWSGKVYEHRDLVTGQVIERCLNRDFPEYEPKSDGTLKPKDKYRYPPKRRSYLLSLPMPLGDFLSDVSVPVAITEGKKQPIALARLATNDNVDFTSLRFLPMAINGAYGWKETVGKVDAPDGGKVAEKGPLAQLGALHWQGRKVYLIPDPDYRTKKQVRDGWNGFAKELQSRGAIVYLVNLPLIEGFNGLDEILGLWEREFGTEKAIEQGQHLIQTTKLFAEPKKENQATRILNFAEEVELFHTPDGDAFARIEVNGHIETHRVRTGPFRAWLAHQFYKTEEQLPSTQSIQDAINAIEGKALYTGAEREVYIRVAGSDGKIYIDVCNEAWQIIEVSKDGWRIIESKKSPVMFYRTKAMLPLPDPAPIERGNVEPLREFINTSDDHYILHLAWLVSCFRPDSPYAVMVETGEQGSAKTTTTVLLRSLVDPNKAPLISPPRNEEDLILAASNSLVCSYDNISSISAWMSDGLCRISTGGGLRKRKLYEDSEETIINVKRPILINGIGDIASAGDLVDRALLCHLKQIPRERRITERAFWAKFEKVKPVIFSGLLNAVSAALRNLESVDLKELPRMADFAEWGVAAESGLGLEEGSFLKAYKNNRAKANDTVLEDSPLALAIIKHLASVSEFEGTMQRLLGVLKDCVDEELQKSRDFPKSPRGLRSKLMRINPNLRAVGINIKFGEKTEHGRMVKIEKICNQPSEQSDSQESPQNLVETADGSGFNSQPTVSQQSANSQGDKLHLDNGLSYIPDGSDGSDGFEQGYSAYDEVM